jgi:predicted ATPase
MAIATEQSCRMLELRSAISLARLLGSDGRKSEAHDLLGPMYGAFTEGFGRADLQTAKTLLAGLS